MPWVAVPGLCSPLGSGHIGWAEPGRGLQKEFSLDALSKCCRKYFKCSISLAGFPATAVPGERPSPTSRVSPVPHWEQARGAQAGGLGMAHGACLQAPTAYQPGQAATRTRAAVLTLCLTEHFSQRGAEQTPASLIVFQGTGKSWKTKPNPSLTATGSWNGCASP